MKIFIVGLLLTCEFFSGCSTVNIPANVAAPVSPELIHSTKLTKQTPNSGHIIVVRDNGFLGQGCNFNIYLDTTLVATIKKPGTKVDIYPAPGNYVLSASNITSMCANQRSGVNILVKTGDLHIYDLSMFSSGDLLLYPSAK